MIRLDSVTFYRYSTRVGHLRRVDNRAVVLDGVTVQINAGERVALLGENGAGKTTLMRIMAGVFEPHRGSAAIHHDSSAILDSGFGIELWLTGRENAESRLILSGVPKGERQELIASLENFLELGTYFNEHTHTYSVGMLARLAFGLATLQPRAVLIIDESFGAIDERFQRRAWNRLSEIIEQGSVLVMASHSLEQLRTYCTRGLLLKNGSLVADGPIDQVIATYSST